MALTPDRVRAYREDYRAEVVGSGYRGWLHLATLTAICVTAIIAALAMIESFRWIELLIVPGAWVMANLIEYAAHRGPMHHLGFGFGRLYRRHTSQHHRFFSREVMAVDSSDDFQATLFPAWLSLFFVGLIGVPMALVVYWLLGRDLALLFYAAIVSYYLIYEWAHLSAHMPEDSALGRLPLIGFARSHHGLHHDPTKMRRANFNFALPLADWLFGTWER
ncbi:Fatty acid hydroxylase superfamily protein [Enhygromyxa salina]|uniref:Fatty acid hydroxylase superfamily protein n=1 Tax=Enhygromyxa salina TaxID=215803 RepID=A0A2S9YFS8_9BACT|nr:sterol desaturase family protein [Enhygromyxa salina]PRQ03856.1 Fatty acid hydroxylase superfamily protein [Enhygromyxa salina]